MVIMADKNKLCGIKEIQECCGSMWLPISPTSVMSMISLSGLPAKKLGGVWISDVEMIEKWRSGYIAGMPIPGKTPAKSTKRFGSK